MRIPKILHFYRLIFWGCLLFLFAPLFSTLARPQKPTIVYQASAPAKWDIYTMDVDGSNVRRLTNGPGNYWHPDWSPDGTRILFSDTSRGMLAIMDWDGSHFQWLPTEGVFLPLHPIRINLSIFLCLSPQVDEGLGGLGGWGIGVKSGDSPVFTPSEVGA